MDYTESKTFRDGSTMDRSARLSFLSFLACLLLGYNSIACAGLVEGIYLTQSTAENTTYLNYLIQKAKSVGITTFVIDLERPSKKYQENLVLVKNNHIAYIARIVVFPEGGKPEQIASPAYWEKRYELIKDAVAYGADQIQLDYIRYNTKQPASSANAQHIYKVIEWYKEKLAPLKIPLQIDVFGVTSFGESKNIGQNLKLFASTVDAFCPMVYPSHYEPFREHAVTPYQTVFGSLKAIHTQFSDKLPVKLYAYIELSNYRYPLPGEKKIAYILAELKAVHDAGADGWFAWSAHNRYDSLFHILATLANQQAASNPVISQTKPSTPNYIKQTIASPAHNTSPSKPLLASHFPY